MTNFDFILNQQRSWALNRGIKLVGSKVERGRPVYTNNEQDNYFEPLTDETKRQFNSADGGELEPGLDSRQPKMRALHSSSALCVNLFQYWQRRGDLVPIAACCGFCSSNDQYKMTLKFEEKFVIAKKFKKHPNIDVVFFLKESAGEKTFAIE